MLPARVVAEKLGAKVEWQAPDKVIIKKGIFRMTFRISEKQVNINGEVNYSIPSPFIENGRTYLPVRLLCEYLDATVEWDETTRSVIITKSQD